MLVLIPSERQRGHPEGHPEGSRPVCQRVCLTTPAPACEGWERISLQSGSAHTQTHAHTHTHTHAHTHTHTHKHTHTHTHTHTHGLVSVLGDLMVGRDQHAAQFVSVHHYNITGTSCLCTNLYKSLHAACGASHRKQALEFQTGDEESI